MFYSKKSVKKRKMPGRPPRVSSDTIFKVLKDLPIFCEDGTLKKKADPVWKEACRIMPDINLHNLYLFVHQDRKNIKTSLMKHLNIICTVPTKIKKEKKKKPRYNYDSNWDDYDYYETLDNDENEELNGNVIEAFASMKNNEEYKNVIQKIGVLPFNITYWHPQQINIWNDLINIESTVALIVLDDVVANFEGNFSTGNVYLYALTVKVENFIILLAQMISDSKEFFEIQHFLESWLQTNVLAPSELVVAYSYNLLNAASLAFNSCIFDQYNLRCYKYLINETVNLPPTLIQIDIIGLIKVVDGWVCFENILQPIKDLYLCSIMYLSTIDNLDEFKETVVNVLALCQSPYQSEELETKRRHLWTHLTTDIIQDMNQQYIQHVTGKNGPRSLSVLNTRQDTIINDVPSEIFEFINQLKSLSLEVCDFTMEPEKVPNDYYCPIILDNLIQLLVEFPSWTKVVFKKWEYATLVSTSATKHLSMLNEINEPMKPAHFFVLHFEKIKTLLHQGLYFLNVKNKKKSGQTKGTNSIQLTELTNNGEIENNYEEEMNMLTEVTNDNVDSNDEEIDLFVFKNAIQSVIESLINFDDTVQNMLKSQIKPGQEILVCKTLLDCCTEIKPYERFLGIIAQRFCNTSDGFVDSFKELFTDCYDTVELLDKNELKNSSKLFAHLLISDSVSWNILSAVRLSEKDMTNSKKNFIRIFLRELAEYFGISKLKERFENKVLKTYFLGLFPINPKDSLFAINFYKSIGLKGLGDIIKDDSRPDGEPKTLKRSSSNESLSSNSSACDFVIELRVSKKFGKNKNLQNKRRVVVIK